MTFKINGFKFVTHKCITLKTQERDSMKKENMPSKAEHLANIITGNASTEKISATVQRSHRFPLDLFTQIENMAKLADSSVSSMINEVIEVGLDALYVELPEETVRQICMITEAQIKKANSQVHQKLGKYKSEK